MTQSIESMIEVLQAYKDGKKIEIRDSTKAEWRTCLSPLFNFSSCEYRIAPEPKKKVNELRQRVAELENENSIERNLRVGVEAVFATLNEDIGRLKAERDELKAQWNYYQDFCKSHNANGITDLVVQRDAALAENAAYYQLAKKEVWAAAENELLAQAAVIEFQKDALKTCEEVIDIVWVSHHANRCDDALEHAREALAIPTDSTQILDEVRRAERERVIDKCVELGAIERDGVFAEEIRAME